jgi:hypothetical protein
MLATQYRAKYPCAVESMISDNGSTYDVVVIGGAAFQRGDGSLIASKEFRAVRSNSRELAKNTQSGLQQTTASRPVQTKDIPEPTIVGNAS